MTHDELIEHAARWLRKRKRLPVVLQDVKTVMTSEQPDVIGWTNTGFSTLIECKVFPGDALRDKDKPFRRAPSTGMGFERYFAFPKGFLEHYPNTKNHLPGAWGILEFDDKGKVTIVQKSAQFYERNDRCERSLLVQAVRRATEGWGRRMFGADAPKAPDGDPNPTASKVIRDLRNENTKLRAELRRH